MIGRGEFLEHATFSGNLYGTRFVVFVVLVTVIVVRGGGVDAQKNLVSVCGCSKQAVESIVKSGKICILDLEEQGVKNMKKTGINARYIFIKPPTLEELVRCVTSYISRLLFFVNNLPRK